MTISIFGGDGQLGQDLRLALASHKVIPVHHKDADVADPEAVAAAIGSHAPDWVINAAAVTNVDQCEVDPLPAFAVNAVGARNVAGAAASQGARVLLVSTDYVFDGEKGAPYAEDDVPMPVNAYGVSKLAGECFTRASGAEWYVVRTSGLYGRHPCRGKGRNFVEAMLSLAKEGKTIRVVDDEVLTPTYAEDLAAQIARIVDEAPPAGVYHATNAGQCSWFEFAGEIFRLAGMNVKLEPTGSKEWGAPARRPAFSVLDNAALARVGLDTMAPWQDALERYIRKKLAS